MPAALVGTLSIHAYLQGSICIRPIDCRLYKHHYLYRRANSWHQHRCINQTSTDAEYRSAWDGMAEPTTAPNISHTYTYSHSSSTHSISGRLSRAIRSQWPLDAFGSQLVLYLSNDVERSLSELFLHLRCLLRSSTNAAEFTSPLLSQYAAG